MCCLLLAGIGELDSASHRISVEAIDWSGTDLMLLDSWRVSADAAEARKAEDASISVLRIPIPPSATGNDACSHWSSFIIIN